MLAELFRSGGGVSAKCIHVIGTGRIVFNLLRECVPRPNLVA